MGGYGRSELAPGSDLDLTLLHGSVPEGRLREAVDALLYPLWDAGIQVSHAVRTPEECAALTAVDLSALTAWFDVRLLAGVVEVLERADRLVLKPVRGEPLEALDRIRSWRKEREGRYGIVAHQLEPDLKEGLGGLRDAQTIRWVGLIQAASSGRPATHTGFDVDAFDFLLKVRAALHLATRSRSDVLAAEHHTAVASLLGLADEEGWEARDALVREVCRAGRVIALAAGRVLGDTARNGGDARTTLALPAILAESHSARVLEEMETDGRLEALIPGWSDVSGRPQRDPFHRYPVGWHLIEAAQEARRLLREPDEPFAQRAVEGIRAVTGREVRLLLGALLHDIGKVGRGSHVPMGVERAERILERLGLGEGEAGEDVLFLVREHLLLSDSATRRNLADEDLILHVAARVGDESRLAMLYLLTLADAFATGPAASTPWRLGLVRELVAKVSRTFERGLMDRDRAGALDRAGDAVREALGGFPPEDVDRFLGAVPAAYLLWVAASDARDHVSLVVPPPGLHEARVHIRLGRESGTHVVSIGAADRLGLLASIGASMTLSGLTILSARAFTTAVGVALDVFEVRSTFEEEPVGEDRWRRLRDALTEGLSDPAAQERRLRALQEHYGSHRPAADVPVTVRLDQDASDFFTVAEVGGADRPGLLFDLARAFVDHGVDVHTAHVATYGPRIVDVFYVTDRDGQKLWDPERIEVLRRALSEAARGATLTAGG